MRNERGSENDDWRVKNQAFHANSPCSLKEWPFALAGNGRYVCCVFQIYQKHFQIQVEKTSMNKKN